MARPSRSGERRKRFLPHIARCFAEQGYRRTTTAALAASCEVQETTLYRLWPGKKEMFLAAIEYVYLLSEETWAGVVASTGAESDSGEPSAAERLLEYESRHLGEFGLYRILFAGLSESDDPEIRVALKRTFRNFQRQIEARIRDHRTSREADAAVDSDLTAWALIGLGMVANLSRDADLFDEKERHRLMASVGRLLLEG